MVPELSGEIEVFVWSPKYETGIEIVDTQHRGLVDLINRVGQAPSGADELQGVEDILDQLADYARDHFATEHRLMRDVGLQAGFVRDHVGAHASFVKQLDVMRACLGEAPQNLVPSLLRYLIAWLAEHILVEDQAMAWQVRAVQGGMSAEAASAWASGKASPSHDALVEAMHRMYAELAQRNADLQQANDRLVERERQLDHARRELAQFNAGLGARVAERTAEVYEIQLRLQQEFDTQRALSRQLEHMRRELEAHTHPGQMLETREGIAGELDAIESELDASSGKAFDPSAVREAIGRIRGLLATLPGGR